MSGRGERDFGKEAIETLMSVLEGGAETTNNRPAMIFAGYKQDMTVFLNENAGLKRRVTHYFHFEDYSPKELCQIFLKKLEETNFNTSIKKVTIEKLLEEYFPPAVVCRFNAGLCDKLFSACVTSINNRCMALLCKEAGESFNVNDMRRVKLDDFKTACINVKAEICEENDD